MDYRKRIKDSRYKRKTIDDNLFLNSIIEEHLNKYNCKLRNNYIPKSYLMHYIGNIDMDMIIHSKICETASLIRSFGGETLSSEFIQNLKRTSRKNQRKDESKEGSDSDSTSDSDTDSDSSSDSDSDSISESESE